MACLDVIERWQASIHHENGSDGPPLIASLFDSCSHLFSALICSLQDQESINQETLRSLDRSHSYFLLWADGHQVQNGRLDASLDKSRRARDLTLRLLESICCTLTKRLFPYVNTDNDPDIPHFMAQVEQSTEKLRYLRQHNDKQDSASDTSSDVSSSTSVPELEEIADDLETDTQGLLSLGPRFEEAAVGPVAEEKVAKTSAPGAWDPTQTFTDRIRWRYPTCDVDIATYLGKANWDRLLRYQAVKEENILQQEQAATGIQEIVAHQSKYGATTDGQRTRDSGLGSSVPTAMALEPDDVPPAPSTYAQTVMSYRGERGDTVRVPPLPENAKQGKPFSCVGCGKMLTIRKSSEWKKHLFQDLQPYVCLEANCTYVIPVFETKDQWMNHLQSEHAFLKSEESITCSLCNETMPDRGTATVRHFAAHLEEISLAILPTNPESEDGSESSAVSTQSVYSEDNPQRDLPNLEETSTVPKGDEDKEAVTSLSYPGMLQSASSVPAPPAPARGTSMPVTPNQPLNPKTPGTKKHKCPYCDSDFTRHDVLNSHLLTHHSQEKPFVCQTCSQRFRRLHDLKRHSQLHTGERPHVCPKCERKFARGDALARHRKASGACSDRRGSMTGAPLGEDRLEAPSPEDPPKDSDSQIKADAEHGSSRIAVKAKEEEIIRRALVARQSEEGNSYQNQLPLMETPGQNILIHELAVRDRPFDYLQKVWTGEQDILEGTLEKLADYDDATQKWRLKTHYWKEVDVWNYDFGSPQDQKSAFDNAVYQGHSLDPETPESAAQFLVINGINPSQLTPEQLKVLRNVSRKTKSIKIYHEHLQLYPEPNDFDHTQSPTTTGVVRSPRMTTNPASPRTSAAVSAVEDGLGPKIWTGTHFLPRFIGQADVPGEGPCYFYDDGTHCKTVIDGESVVAHWGVTAAGKPRERLAIACITCREKKIKCDPDFPRCVQCHRFGRVCKFKNAPRGGYTSPLESTEPKSPPKSIADSEAKLADQPSAYHANRNQGDDDNDNSGLSLSESTSDAHKTSNTSTIERGKKRRANQPPSVSDNVAAVTSAGSLDSQFVPAETEPRRSFYRPRNQNSQGSDDDFDKFDSNTLFPESYSFRSSRSPNFPFSQSAYDLDIPQGIRTKHHDPPWNPISLDHAGSAAAALQESLDFKHNDRAKTSHIPPPSAATSYAKTPQIESEHAEHTDGREEDDERSINSVEATGEVEKSLKHFEEKSRRRVEEMSRNLKMLGEQVSRRPNGETGRTEEDARMMTEGSKRLEETTRQFEEETRQFEEEKTRKLEEEARRMTEFLKQLEEEDRQLEEDILKAQERSRSTARE